MKRRVALIIETSSIYGRDLLSGIVRFMRMHDDWSVFLEQRDLAKKPPSWLANWDGDGIISRATTPQLVAVVEANGVPLVELTDRWTDQKMTRVRSDDSAIGRMAAEHLLERGFQRFGFCGFRGEAWSERRQFAFVDAVKKAGWSCDTFESPWVGRSVRTWEAEQKHLANWLSQFSRPFGIMCCNDLRGQHVLDACSNLRLAVPEDAAVIGVDNDELLCRICVTPLSSVIPNAEGVGFHAAQLLAKMMNGEMLKPQELLIEPLGIETRQSTDLIAIDDREIAAALTFIRQNACRGISVLDVTSNVAISRSSLERKVRKYLGRTPQQEIRHVQIKRVKELLLTTDLSAERIAGLCGFEHPEYLHVVFKRITRKTTGEFRRESNPASTL